ncbi:MAG: helix-turn-helix domain-containing protein [Chthonomonadales bacterium]|nr:helix-turn-helix domain-containing protein [Chthonomonadales bacterium]
MADYSDLTPEQRALERAADELLAALPADPRAPARPERRMRAAGGRAMLSLDRLAEMPVAPSQPLRDEIAFLVSVTALPARARLCLGRWADGYSQSEIAARLGVSQQRVSQILRQALAACYANAPLSFRRFSFHTIYRPPRHSRPLVALRICARCGETFPLHLGWGRHCSRACAEAARHRG